jgi:hypothetical protein
VIYAEVWGTGQTLPLKRIVGGAVTAPEDEPATRP